MKQYCLLTLPLLVETMNLMVNCGKYVLILIVTYVHLHGPRPLVWVCTLKLHLNLHIDSVHEKKKPFKCKICDYK